MSGFGIIVVAILAIAGFAVLSRKAQERMKEQGKIVDRKGAFYKEKAIFTTSATPEALFAQFNKIDLSELRASMQADMEGNKSVLFRSGFGWTAIVDYMGKQDEKNIFEFHFSSWETEDGFPKNEVSMNWMLTAVEKAMLAVDPNVIVKREFMEFKSKAKFF